MKPLNTRKWRKTRKDRKRRKNHPLELCADKIAREQLNSYLSDLADWSKLI